MTRTIGRQVLAGYLVSLAATLLILIIATIAQLFVVDAKNRVIQRDSRLVLNAARLENALLEQSAGIRGYLLSGDEAQAAQARRSAARFQEVLTALRDDVHTDAGRELQERIDALKEDYDEAAAASTDLRRSGATDGRLENGH